MMEWSGVLTDRGRKVECAMGMRATRGITCRSVLSCVAPPPPSCLPQQHLRLTPHPSTHTPPHPTLNYFPHSPDLLLVMLPSRSPSLYQEVKVATDAALGIPSQVLVAPVAGVGLAAQPRGRLQYCNNLGERVSCVMMAAVDVAAGSAVRDDLEEKHTERDSETERGEGG